MFLKPLDLCYFIYILYKTLEKDVERKKINDKMEEKNKREGEND